MLFYKVQLNQLYWHLTRVYQTMVLFILKGNPVPRNKLATAVWIKHDQVAGLIGL